MAIWTSKVSHLGSIKLKISACIIMWLHQIQLVMKEDTLMVCFMKDQNISDTTSLIGYIILNEESVDLVYMCI